MRIDVLSIFPELFEPIVANSMLGIARERGALEFYAHDLRDWTHDLHRTVDDAPYGGGPGMVMKVDILVPAIEDIAAMDSRLPHVVFTTPTGNVFNQDKAAEYAGRDRLLLVCGRYEGFDERAYALADECMSIGDYVLTGGELAALVIVDATTRLLPRVLGNADSAADESFSAGLLEYPQYTRPAEFRGQRVPDVLLSGNHAAIDAWRYEQSVQRTRDVRPDLLDLLE
ncbi:MAG: tRNA (guanosine(37)-N1)-methyltransferase TrmD [Actinomycetes bacterium]|jgi:tRNA (guanine37-N1)-methyltransferase|nr:tRNA (guanosine(37)-N1)-methyltransferase TrmD [Actinomycetes bacterium]